MEMLIAMVKSKLQRISPGEESTSVRLDRTSELTTYTELQSTW